MAVQVLTTNGELNLHTSGVFWTVDSTGHLHVKSDAGSTIASYHLGAWATALKPTTK
jgi:hypothetical protein